MRIIAGSAGRIAIKVPPAVARPTTDFVRQAIFSILAGRVENARVLDLFAGSGAIGLEALSRGAASCVFVMNTARPARSSRKTSPKPASKAAAP
jgi:16S rRNA (guanine966-N2)-methyltransferase